MGLTPVRSGDVATVVTSLEMVERPDLPEPPPSPLSLVRWPAPGLTRYRDLFRRVGGPWLWYSRLAMADADLARILENPDVQVHAVRDADADGDVGMLELDFREPDSCELSYVGLVPGRTGKGHGRWLMAHALRLAWRPGVRRVWVHTCTLDHPGALRFYRRSGFRPFKRTMETFPDPRILGLLPPDMGAHVPMLADPPGGAPPER
ncbi:GNAT family N-acetyltransferase [Stakelama saccharophila]|uniref:GNAT family N-acetyltransferase n=1 Tax=Stakelama saccharophila TaxID=3075605 RepID=A0ABZ0B748_9SPHN|nr:GNAT family N-acetyltransferase [Stakelama sp. W311]WNO53219.1 GNAT family N-acetyltransferase [Stakelama sp. W311]